MVAKIEPIEVGIELGPAEGVYLIPMGPGRTVAIAGPWPLTNREWGRLEATLTLFRPGLVEAEDEAPT